MKKCSYCGAEYPDDAFGCAIDHTPLSSPEGVEAGSENDQPPKVHSPLQKVVVIASFSCLVSLIFLYCIARLGFSHFQVRWLELLGYAVIPTSVTFGILYCSGWHREVAGTARACGLLLVSFIILGSELIAVGIVYCLAVLGVCMSEVGLKALSGGNH